MDLRTIRRAITLLQILVGGIFLLIPYSHDYSIHVQLSTLMTYKVSIYTLPPYFVLKIDFTSPAVFVNQVQKKIKIWKVLICFVNKTHI